MTIFWSTDSRHVKRGEIREAARTIKAAEPLVVKLSPPLVRYAKAEHVCSLGSIAVTFGTLGKLFDKTWAFGKLEIEVSRLQNQILL